MESTRILKSIAFGIIFFMTLYTVLSLIGTLFCSSFKTVITEPNWFIIYTVLSIVPTIGMARTYYEDLIENNNKLKNQFQ